MKQSEYLIGLQKKIIQFDGKSLKENRKQLAQTIQEITKEYKLTRNDNNGVVELSFDIHPSLKPEILIGVDNDRNIFIADCGLWRMIEGVYESEEEEAIQKHEMRMNRY